MAKACNEGDLENRQARFAALGTVGVGSVGEERCIALRISRAVRYCKVSWRLAGPFATRYVVRNP